MMVKTVVPTATRPSAQSASEAEAERTNSGTLVSQDTTIHHTAKSRNTVLRQRVRRVTRPLDVEPKQWQLTDSPNPRAR